MNGVADPDVGSLRGRRSRQRRPVGPHIKTRQEEENCKSISFPPARHARHAQSTGCDVSEMA